MVDLVYTDMIPNWIRNIHALKNIYNINDMWYVDLTHEERSQF